MGSTFAHYKKLVAPLPKIYTLQEIENAVADEKAVIAAMADGFRAYSAGRFSVPPIQTMGHSLVRSSQNRLAVQRRPV